MDLIERYLAAVGILHCTVGLRQYVITDQRLLVLSSFSHDVHDSCELPDITGFSNPRYLHSLIIGRKQGKPLRLWALADREEAEEALSVDRESEPPQA